jgi:hypothetical protein
VSGDRRQNARDSLPALRHHNSFGRKLFENLKASLLELRCSDFQRLASIRSAGKFGRRIGVSL